MTNFIPIFPLNLVVYPGEELKLHVFEPRYKQMIRECVADNKSFGIPGIIEQELKDYGTLMEILAVDKTYDNGEMDIRVKGTSVFRVLEVIHEVPEKLYSGAIVHYPENVFQGSPGMMKKIIRSLRTLHKLMRVKRDFSKPEHALRSYDVAHEAGLSPTQEYEMLCLLHELQRQEYLRRHLKKVISTVAEWEQLKLKARSNGHYRHLSSDDF